MSQQAATASAFGRVGAGGRATRAFSAVSIASMAAKGVSCLIPRGPAVLRTATTRRCCSAGGTLAICSAAHVRVAAIRPAAAKEGQGRCQRAAGRHAGEGRFTVTGPAVSRYRRDGQSGLATMDGGRAAAKPVTFTGRLSRCLTMSGGRDCPLRKAIALAVRELAVLLPPSDGEAREAVTATTCKRGEVRGCPVS